MKNMQVQVRRDWKGRRKKGMLKRMSYNYTYITYNGVM
jgi:hypothetical protein